MTINKKAFFDLVVIFSHLGALQYLLLPDAFFHIGNVWIDYVLPVNLFLCMSLYFYFFYDLCIRNDLNNKRIFWVFLFILLFFVAPVIYYYFSYRKGRKGKKRGRP